MQSKATTVQQYLAELPADRRAALQAVREVILKNLDKGYEEGMQYGMIGYYVPHRLFPAGYHCDPRQPLPFAGLASQKNYMSVYLMTTYDAGNEGNRFRAAWAKTGKKLDMGKCCIRFKKLEDLALEVIGETVRRVPAGAYIAHYENTLRDRSSAGGAPKRTSPKKTTAKPAASAKKTPARKTSAKKPARRPTKAARAAR